MGKNSKHILLFIKSNYHELLLHKELQENFQDFIITTAKTKSEALNILAVESVHALVVDINSKEFEEICEVHQIHLCLPTLPIIAMVDDFSIEFSKRLQVIGVTKSLPKDETFYIAVSEILKKVFTQEILPMRIQREEGGLKLSEHLKFTSRTLSHEINNPLMTILGITELLLDVQSLNDKELIKKIKTIRKSARRIQQSTHRMSHIISPVYQKTPCGAMLDPQKSRIYTKTKVKLSETE